MYLVYFVGPFSDKLWSERCHLAKDRIKSFERYEDLWPVIPDIEWVNYLPDKFRDAKREIMSRCDAVLLLTGYHKDETAVQDKAMAEQMRVPVAKSMLELEVIVKGLKEKERIRSKRED